MRLLPIVLVFALLAGCKGMGGLASGLGHVAGGMAKVASGVGHVAGSMGHAMGGVGHAMGGVGKVASGAGNVVTAVGRVTGSALSHAVPAVARVAQKTLPIAEDIAEAALETVPIPDDPPQEAVDDDGHPVSIGGPLIDNHDSCNQCPDDLSCDQCTGANGAACRWTPAGAFARCESTN